VRSDTDDPFEGDEEAKAAFLCEYFEGQALARTLEAEAAFRQADQHLRHAHYLAFMATDCTLAEDPRVDLDRLLVLASRMRADGGWGDQALEEYLEVYIPEVS